MPLNSEFKSLCNRWKEKASKYDASDTHSLFDKYFSLYVVFNALYAETAAYLHRKDIDEKRGGYKLQEGSFPDKNAATQYVLNLLKAKSLMQSLEDNTETNLAIEEIKKLLTPQNSHHFWICLDPVFGEPQENEDQKLLQALSSSNAHHRAEAILKIIYQVRCNMFHGRKSVEPIQKQLLLPLIVLLEKIIEKLYQKLDSAEYI